MVRIIINLILSFLRLQEFIWSIFLGNKTVTFRPVPTSPDHTMVACEFTHFGSSHKPLWHYSGGRVCGRELPGHWALMLKSNILGIMLRA